MNTMTKPETEKLPEFTIVAGAEWEVEAVVNAHLREGWALHGGMSVVSVVGNYDVPAVRCIQPMIRAQTGGATPDAAPDAVEWQDILRDICESPVADPDHTNTICIDRDFLQSILESHLAHARSAGGEG
jgi:hypothetical protein